MCVCVYACVHACVRACVREHRHLLIHAYCYVHVHNPPVLTRKVNIPAFMCFSVVFVVCLSVFELLRVDTYTEITYGYAVYVRIQ